MSETLFRDLIDRRILILAHGILSAGEVKTPGYGGCVLILSESENLLFKVQNAPQILRNWIQDECPWAVSYRNILGNVRTDQLSGVQILLDREKCVRTLSIPFHDR